ncbi:MAG: ParB/RepB/Spo0J family partition protein, partial [Pseudohongiellaceae bacterium]
MAVKKRGLGRGLDALLGGKARPGQDPAVEKPDTKTQAAPDQDSQGQEGQLLKLPIEYIQPGRYQPRLDMRPETLEELANSIKSQGLMQPIVVRPQGSKNYEIIAGERRWRACQIAGLDTIPALIREVEDEAAVAMALIENIQRENLNPMEEAMALKRLQDEFELTQQEVADAVGKSRATVTNLMRLMNLNPDVRKFLEHGDLEMGHAR